MIIDGPTTTKHTKRTRVHLSNLLRDTGEQDVIENSNDPQVLVDDENLEQAEMDCDIGGLKECIDGY